MMNFVSKKLLTLLLVAYLPLFSLTAQAKSSTQWILMDRYQMPMDSSAVYLVEHTGWQLPSCLNARYAQLQRSNENFEEAFATVMSANLLRKKIIIHGTCHPTNSDHVFVSYLVLENVFDD